MRLIFANNYKDDAERVAATVAWVKSVQAGVAPNTAPVLGPALQNSKPNEDLGATRAWKIQSPQSDRGYALLFQTLNGQTPNTECAGKVALDYLVKPFNGFSLRLLQLGKDSSDVLACYAIDGKLFLFDPGTALWQITSAEPGNFATHMRGHFATSKQTELLSWVVPVPCARVARSVAEDRASPAYGKACTMQCWDAVAYCALLSGVIDQARYEAVAVDGGRDRQSRTHHVLATGSDPSVSSEVAMASLPGNHAICFFRWADSVDLGFGTDEIGVVKKRKKQKKEWAMIHAMLSLGGGMAAGTKNACLMTSQGGTIGTIGWEVLDLRELNWKDGVDYLEQGGDNIYVHHRPIADLAQPQPAQAATSNG